MRIVNSCHDIRYHKYRGGFTEYFRSKMENTRIRILRYKYYNIFFKYEIFFSNCECQMPTVLEIQNLSSKCLLHHNRYRPLQKIKSVMFPCVIQTI